MSRGRNARRRSHLCHAVAALGLAALLVAAATPGLARAQDSTVVTAGQATVGVGTTGAVTVDVSGVSDVYGAEVRLEFDPRVVEVADADPRTDGIQVQIGDFLPADLVARHIVDNAAGTIQVAWTQLYPNPPRNGDGRLLSVLFRGRAGGATSPVTLRLASLATRDAERIPVTTRDGSVRVAGSGTVPATPTPTPLAERTTASAAQPTSRPPAAATTVGSTAPVLPTSSLPVAPAVGTARATVSAVVASGTGKAGEAALPSATGGPMTSAGTAAPGTPPGGEAGPGPTEAMAVAGATVAAGPAPGSGPGPGTPPGPRWNVLVVGTMLLAVAGWFLWRRR